MKKSIGSGRGSVYNILLKSLQSGDKYGYEICKEIEEKTNGSYILKQPSLYSGLKRLEAQNLITSYWRDSDLGGRRHYYSLTESGKQKIEDSNFSWDDTRDDIVNSLFEKSEIEQKIDCVVKEIDGLKVQNNNSDALQEEIDEVINSTEQLVDNTIKSQEEPYDGLQGSEQNDNLLANNQDANDLFSIFSNFSKETDDTTTYDEQSNLSSDDTSIENEMSDLQNNTEEFDGQDDLLKNKKDDSAEQPNTSEIVSQKEEDMVPTDTQLDLFSFIQEQEDNKDDAKKIQEAESDGDNPVDISNEGQYDDIIRNFTTYRQDDFSYAEMVESEKEETTDQNDGTEIEKQNCNLYEEDSEIEENHKLSQTIGQPEQSTLKPDAMTDLNLEKNETEFINDYKRNKISISSFSDNAKFEKNEQTYFSAYNDNELENKNDFEDVSALSETTEYSADDEFDTMKVQEKITSEVSNSSAQFNQIDYKNIFGDLIASDSQIQNNTQTEESTKTVSSEILKQDDKQETVTNKFEDLPRVNLHRNDINRTLTVDEAMLEELNQYYDTNQFQSLDNKIKENAFDEQFQQDESLWQKTDSVPFNKKYENSYQTFDAPEYQIRYYKKPSQSKTKQSRFISINKLNAVNSLIICLMIVVATAITWIFASKSTTISTNQIYIYIACLTVGVLQFLYNFAKYILNKTKKSLEINKNGLAYNSFFAVLIIVLTLALNILFGMKLDNILEYSASFILPMCLSLILLINPLIKKILSKLSNFYIS